MKTLNETFEDKDFEFMKKFKGKLSWKDFILLMFAHCSDAQEEGDFEIFEGGKHK